MNRKTLVRLMMFLTAGLAGACARPPEVVPPPRAEEVSPPKAEVAAPPKVEEVPPLDAVAWQEVDGWGKENPVPALETFLKSCAAISSRPMWQGVCSEASAIDLNDGEAVRRFFEERFIPYQVRNPDGSDTGLITGYYVPELKGSRSRTKKFSYPIYGVPDDLLVIDLGSVYPELGNYRMRGRVVGRRVVPYWDRAEIDGGKAPLKGQELFWVEDPVELFFLQVQGSGRIVLQDGEKVMVNYGDQNGRPYRSIGKTLLERGAMTRDQMSMQNIKAWGRNNPDLVGKLLNENPSYVFFRELSPGVKSPPGALGVPLTAGRSLAVDPRTIPLGAPVFISTTRPCTSDCLQRLMVAQDTGGAIKGAVRADFFWGLGGAAGDLAGRMKQKGRLWVLLPLEVTLSEGRVAGR
jgi:membrane-bound lytic murein transglycosylase A